MRCITLTLVVTALLGGPPAALCAQGTASAAAPSPSSQVLLATSTNPAAPQRAIVLYNRGQLEVSAQNSSLSQILGDIAGRTGMKITGTVNEEHMFGLYGPGTPASVLTKLLEGTGTNMVLRASSSGLPTELILTPRTGSPDPPCPNAPCSTNTTATTQMTPHSVGSSLPPGSTADGSAVPGSGTPAHPPVPYGSVDPATGLTVWPPHHVTRTQ